MQIRRRDDCATLTARIPTPNTARPALRRSMGTSDESEAQARALALTALAQSAGSPNWDKVSGLVGDVFRSFGLEPPQLRPLPLPALVLVKDLVPRYLAKNRGGESYQTLCARALESFWAGHKDLEVRAVIGQHVQDWVDQLMAGRNTGTVRNWLGALSGFFRYAIKMGHAVVNPCATVDLERYEGVVNRLPMSEADLAKLLTRLEGPQMVEWRTLTLLGRYAGLRLQDAAKVTGEAVTWPEGACLLNLTPGKTRNPEVLPLFGPIVEHLRAIQRPGLLCPVLAGMSVDRLSRQFIGHCDAAGIDPQMIVLENGRKYRRISNHSLRHGFVTGLSLLGIPQELRKKMSAHATDSAHEAYVHADGLALHQQVSKYFTP